jgi:hypothetical protein
VQPAELNSAALYATLAAVLVLMQGLAMMMALRLMLSGVCSCAAQATLAGCHMVYSLMQKRRRIIRLCWQQNACCHSMHTISWHAIMQEYLV